VFDDPLLLVIGLQKARAPTPEPSIYAAPASSSDPAASAALNKNGSGELTRGRAGVVPVPPLIR
jgi:hypothetical protein